MGHTNAQMRDYRAKRQRFNDSLRIVKQAQGCADCGARDRMLVHHHLDPATKRRTVSQMTMHSFESFVDEVAKCIVLCVPCHRRRHEYIRHGH